MAPKSKPTTQLSMAEIMDFITQTGSKDLQELSFAIEKQRLAKRDGELSDAKEKIEAILAKIGSTLYDVFPELKVKRTINGTGEVAPKYRNPNNSAETWSGRGKRPNWLKHVLAGRGIDTDKGGIPQDLLIQ